MGQDEQQSTKKNDYMKTTTTTKTGMKAREQSEQVFRAQQPEAAKYIVIRWNGSEQVVSFPFEARHADVLRYVRQECGEAQALSAGFFINDPEALWVGGESDTLNLQSRAEDRELVQSFLSSADRRLWDLTLVAREAEEAAALAGANR